METVAASWQGAVRVALFERDGTDWAEVRLVPWRGQGTRRTLYVGPIGEYMNTINPDATRAGDVMRRECIAVVEALLEEEDDNGAVRDRAGALLALLQAACTVEGGAK